MSAPDQNRPTASWAARLSLDGWAVTLAFALVALVRLGVLKRVPW